MRASARWPASKRHSTTTPPTARKSAGCPLGNDPAQFVARYHAARRPAGATARADLRSARAELSGRHHRHRQRAVHAAVLEVPDQRAARAAARHRRRRPAVAGRRLPGPRLGRPLRATSRTRSTRSAASTRPIPTDPAVWADADRRIREAAPFMAYGEFTGFAPRDMCAMWPVPPTSAPHARDVAGPGQGRGRVDHPRPGHPVPGGRGPGPRAGRRR